MKKTIIILITLGLLISFHKIVAEEVDVLENEAVLVNTMTQTLGDIELEEAAGVLPDNPFYFVKTWGEKIKEFVTFDNVKKTEYKLKLAERRLAEARALIEKGKTEKGERIIAKYQQRLEEVNQEVVTLQSQNKNVEELVKKLEAQTVQHQAVLTQVLEKVPAQAKTAIQKAKTVSEQGHERAIEAIQNLKAKIKDINKQNELESLLNKAKVRAKSFQVTPSPAKSIQNVNATLKEAPLIFEEDETNQNIQIE